MSRFIEPKKFMALREAMKNGDERAKKILFAQRNNELDGFDDLLADYFNRKDEIIEANNEESANLSQNKPKLEEIVVKKEENTAENNIFLHIVEDILNSVKELDAITIALMNKKDLTGATKKGALQTLQEIKNSNLENIDKINSLKESLEKKDTNLE